MEKLMLVRPTKEYEQQAKDFIEEHRKYQSPIEGVNGLHRYINNYDKWLEKIEQERTNKIDDSNVPMETFFIIRTSDNKIIGMTNLRMALNRRFRRLGGNIGLCIRPTERNKGYSKIALYIALLIFQARGIQEIMLDCNKANTSSVKSIQSMGGKLVKEEYIQDFECTKQDYTLDVLTAINNFAPIYEPYIAMNESYENTSIPKI